MLGDIEYNLVIKCIIVWWLKSVVIKYLFSLVIGSCWLINDFVIYVIDSWKYVIL